MIQTIKGKTADDIWLGVSEAFRLNQSVRAQPSRGGKTVEILHVALSLENARERWVTCRRPAINVAFALAEVVWLITGRNDSGFLTYWNRRLSTFAGSSDFYHGAYGHRLRRHFGLDQLDAAYRALLKNGESRQVALQIWDPRVDLPLEDGTPSNQDIPCNVMAMLKLRSGTLEWMQIVRSNDVFLGLPHNLVQFTTLQEVLAGWLQVDVGTYNQLSDSLHVYDRDLSNVLNSHVPSFSSNSST